MDTPDGKTYRCSNCKQHLPREAYGRKKINEERGIRDGADYVCRSCRSAYHRERMADPVKRARAAEVKAQSKARNPEQSWASYIGIRFGLSPADYHRMLAEQNGVCAICGADTPRNRSKTRFSIDHDHATGEVRGLLCGPCNTGIGHLQDNPVVLQAAIDYLMRANVG